MLVLARVVGERIVLSQNGVVLGVIKVHEANGPNVKLAIDMDTSIDISREELLEPEWETTGMVVRKRTD